MASGNSKIRRKTWSLSLMGWLLGLVLLSAVDSWAIASQLKATLIDRFDNKHEIEKFSYQDRLEIEYYVDGDRKIVGLKDITSMRFDGDRRDEQFPISVVMRTGRTESGQILSGAGVSPHQDALGGVGSASRFTGVTSLGPFEILIRDVREIIMRHPESLPPAVEIRLKATLITIDGKMFEVEDLQYRDKMRMDYNIGSRRRFANLVKVAKIDLAEGGPADEIRPVTITYWSGKTVQGTVDAGTVRLPGETDKSFYKRVNEGFTGRVEGGGFSIGLHLVKQVRFRPADEEQEEPAGEEQEEPAGEEQEEPEEKE